MSTTVVNGKLAATKGLAIRAETISSQKVAQAMTTFMPLRSSFGSSYRTTVSVMRSLVDAVEPLNLTCDTADLKSRETARILPIGSIPYS